MFLKIVSSVLSFKGSLDWVGCDSLGWVVVCFWVGLSISE